MTAASPRGKKRTFTFGELLLRLSAPGVERFLQSPSFVASFGGGEANVAISLAGFGLDSHFVTRIPEHSIGDAALRALRSEGVNTEHVLRGGERLGLYYAETGVGQRASSVVYDRARSSITDLDPADIAWAEILEGAHWFHVTGITPALGAKPAACARAGLEAAKRAGVNVSLDLNYRSKLWSRERARREMVPLLEFVDIVVASDEDLEATLGMSVPNTDVVGGKADPARYAAVGEKVAQQFGVQMVAITLRERLSASESGWGAVLYERASNSFFKTERFRIPLVDRIGAGDSFCAGLIYAVVTGRSAERALAFAAAASALKQTIPGDYNRVSVEEVDRLVGGEMSGRVRR